MKYRTGELQNNHPTPALPDGVSTRHPVTISPGINEGLAQPQREESRPLTPRPTQEHVCSRSRAGSGLSSCLAGWQWKKRTFFRYPLGDRQGPTPARRPVLIGLNLSMGEKKKKKEREAARLGAAPRNSRVSGGSGHTSAGGAPPLPRPPPSVPTAPRGRRRDRPRGTHLPHGSRSPVPAGGLPRPASAQPAARRRQRPALSEGRGAARPAALRARARPPPPTAPAPGGPEPTAVRPHTAITRGAAATTPGPRARRPLPSSPPSLPASLPPAAVTAALPSPSRGRSRTWVWCGGRRTPCSGAAPAARAAAGRTTPPAASRSLRRSVHRSPSWWDNSATNNHRN